MKHLSSPLGPLIWAALLFSIMLLWLYPLMGWFLDASYQTGSGTKPMLIAGSLLVAALSLVFGSVLRWLAAATTKAAPLAGAAFAGPMLGGWVSVASPDLRGALSLQLNGLAPFYLLYLGTWIATLAYLMKVPWDRVTELGRDKLLGKKSDAEPGPAVAGGSLTDFPATVFLLVSIAGLATFCVLIGAGVTVSGVGQWLLKPPDTLVALIGSALVSTGLVFTAQQWRADARAKQDEARARRIGQYAERIQQFRTPATNAAIMMLLNYDRDIILPAFEGRQRVRWEDTATALVPGMFRHYLYEPLLTAIRDCFNDLLEGMSRLHFLLGEGLVRPEDVDHICKPLLTRLVSDPEFANQALARNLRLYILWRNARGVLYLCQRYGLELRAMQDADVEALEHDIAAGSYGPCERTGWGDLSAGAGVENAPLI